MNLKEIIIKSVKNLDDCVENYLLLNRFVLAVSLKLPYVHDYYTQRIKDIPIHFKPTFLFYDNHRYACPNCGKKFFEPSSLVSKYARRFSRLTHLVIHELRNLTSQKDVAKRTNIPRNFCFLEK